MIHCNDRQLITHTFGMASLENDSLARYYMAIGDPERATFLGRYFGGDDATREALLPRLREVVKSFVSVTSTPSYCF